MIKNYVFNNFLKSKQVSQINIYRIYIYIIYIYIYKLFSNNKNLKFAYIYN